MMITKKGEMTTQQIVTLVILILSFAVILFFLFRLNFGDETQKELCHNSVVTRSSAVIPTDAVPLECSRQYICLTEDGSCENMTKPKIHKVETKEEVYDVLAEEMADCWWMFGEGKLNYVGSDWLPELYCSICAQVGFDDSVVEELGEDKLDKGEFYHYLTIKNMTGQNQKYSDYLFKTRNVEEIHSGEFGKIDLTKTYFILTGMTSDVSTLGWATVAGAGAAAIALAPFTFGGSTGIFWGAIIAAGGAGVGAAGSEGAEYLASVVNGESGDQFITPSLIEANSQNFKDLKCGTIATLS